MKRRIFCYQSAVVVAFVLADCRTAPIYNVSGAGYSPKSDQTLEGVAQAIERSGARLGWDIAPVGVGKMRGTLKLRTHVAVVDISYDLQNFSVSYVCSANLLHRGNEIHRNYNNWIRNLEDAIRAEVSGGSGLDSSASPRPN